MSSLAVGQAEQITPVLLLSLRFSESVRFRCLLNFMQCVGTEAFSPSDFVEVTTVVR